jgi:uncharacterized membrane protein HdeD (DUF308 family)
MATPRTAERTLERAFLVGGVLALVSGAALVLWRETGMTIAAVLLGLWWLTHAALIVFSARIDREDSTWKVTVAALGGAAGLAALVVPVQSEAFLDSAISFVLGALGVMVAVVAFYGGFRDGGMGSMLFGVVSGAVGALLLVYPGGAMATFVIVVGVILVVHGIAAIVIALNAREPSVEGG